MNKNKKNMSALLACSWSVACLENVGGVLPAPDPKLVVLDYWGIFPYFCHPTISLFPQFLISGANACSWWDVSWSDYCIIIPHFDTWITWAPRNCDTLVPPPDLRWSRQDPSFGGKIRRTQGFNGFKFMFDRQDPSFERKIRIRRRGGGSDGLKCLLAAPLLSPCCHHLDPVPPPLPHLPLFTQMFFSPFLSDTTQKLVCLLILCLLWDCEGRWLNLNLNLVKFSCCNSICQLKNTNQPYIFYQKSLFKPSDMKP